MPSPEFLEKHPCFKTREGLEEKMAEIEDMSPTDAVLGIIVMHTALLHNLDHVLDGIKQADPELLAESTAFVQFIADSHTSLVNKLLRVEPELNRMGKLLTIIHLAIDEGLVLEL